MLWFRSLVVSVALFGSWAAADVPLHQLEQLRSHTFARSVPCSEGLELDGAVACWTYPVSLVLLASDLHGAASLYPNVEVLGGYVSGGRFTGRLEIDGVDLVLDGADGFVVVYVEP